MCWLLPTPCSSNQWYKKYHKDLTHDQFLHGLCMYNRYTLFGLIESTFYILKKPEVSSVGNKLTKTCAIYRLQTLITGLFQSPSGIP